MRFTVKFCWASTSITCIRLLAHLKTLTICAFIDANSLAVSIVPNILRTAPYCLLNRTTTGFSSRKILPNDAEPSFSPRNYGLTSDAPSNGPPGMNTTQPARSRSQKSSSSGPWSIFFLGPAAGMRRRHLLALLPFLSLTPSSFVYPFSLPAASRIPGRSCMARCRSLASKPTTMVVSCSACSCLPTICWR